MDEPEDNRKCQGENSAYSQESMAESTAPLDVASVGRVIDALNLRHRKFDAITKLGADAQLLALSTRILPFTDLAAIEKIAQMVDAAASPHRYLQGLDGAIGLAARGEMLGRHSALAALARGFPGSALPNWAVLQEHSRIGQLMRSQRWADRIFAGALGLTTDRIARLAAAGAVSDELRLVAERASSMRVDSAMSVMKISPGIETMLSRNVQIRETLTKLSVFAGAVETVGALSPTSSAAMGSLLGEWRSRPELPDEFWRNRSVRQRYYEEAEVDRGLIDARNTEIVEVLVESGLVEGVVHGSSVTAVIEAGPLSVQVSASRTRMGAYRAITSFEIAMRGLVKQVLMDAQINSGENSDAWFKQRVPGDVLKRALERKAEAERVGELAADLIAFVDLGDLIPIVTFGKNWRVFEPIFGSAEDFRVDMRRLNAIRRPAMHSRAIDPVQFTEMVIVIGRMNSLIREGFGWMAEWDEEN